MADRNLVSWYCSELKMCLQDMLCSNVLGSERDLRRARIQVHNLCHNLKMKMMSLKKKMMMMSDWMSWRMNWRN
jgi:hypothetical protein